MTWLRLDDQFPEHRRIQALSDKAFRLHVTAMCLCSRKLTDGVIHSLDLKVLFALSSASKKHEKELVSAGVWEPVDEGFQVRDFLDYNPSAATVKAKRRANADRQQEWRNGKRNALRVSAPSHPIPNKGILREQPVDKPCVCPDCKIGFATQWRLDEHRANVHHAA